MFSTFIRLGAVLSSAAILCSCGGNSIAETQQSTPEGIFNGTYGVYLSPTVPNTSGAVSCTVNVLTFIEATGAIFNFYPSAADASQLYAADEGAVTFAGDSMSSSNMIQVSEANSPVPGCFPSAATGIGGDPQTGRASSYAMSGTYITGQSISGTFTYPVSLAYPAFGGTGTTSLYDVTTFTTIPYNTDYQGVQDLATLAGTFTGTVATSLKTEAATFTISPPSVPANGGNSLGVSILSGTSASGCAFTGSISPLFKGNGYTSLITTGNAPCLLPGTQFSGLIYLDTTTNIMYSFAPNTARTDGLIFSGRRN